MTLDELKGNNARNGMHFFSPDTLRFFRSRVSARIYRRADGRRAYFVTSEKARGCPRRYTVRYTDDGGATIHTAGKFQGFARSHTAHARAQWLANGGE